MTSENTKAGCIGCGVVAALAGLVIGYRSFTTVPAGYVQVRNLFGNVYKEELTPGMHAINPLTGGELIDVRTRQLEEKMEVPTREGLIAGLDVSVVYHVNPTKASDIYSGIGLEYEKTIVTPFIRNATRDTVAKYVAADLYGSARGKISNDIFTAIQPEYNTRGFILERVLLRDVRIPQKVKDAIETKLQAQQQAEQMEFVLNKQKQESERMRIEADGIADSQKIIAGSLSAQYLQWKYLDTLHELSKSQNTTFIITPFDQKIVPFLPLQSQKK